MAIVTLKKKKSKVFWSYNHKCYVLPQLIFEDWVKSEKDRKFKIRRKAEVVYIQGDTERHSCFRKKKVMGLYEMEVTSVKQHHLSTRDDRLVSEILSVCYVSDEHALWSVTNSL